MNFDPSLPDDSRRNFVKKSLAASIIAAQPTILAGLIRAQGGGGGTGTTDPWGGTEPVTEPVSTTGPWDTTVFETTMVETTVVVENPHVTKGEVVGDETPTPDTSTGTSTVIVKKSGTQKFKSTLQWEFSMKNTVATDVQPGKVKIDCVSCEASEVLLKLNFVIDEDTRTTAQKNSKPFSVPGPYVGPDLKRGVTVTAVKRTENGNSVAKLETSATHGEPDIGNNGIKIEITSKITPEGDVSTKNIEWTVKPDVSTVPLGAIKTEITNTVRDMFDVSPDDTDFKDWEFIVEVPTPLATSNIVNQSATAELTTEEVHAGAGCSIE